MWWSRDPKGQLFNPYGYSSNPINTVDPNGEYIIGAILGALAGGYISGAMSSGSLNPTDWKGMDWLSAGMGAISGAQIGSGLENSIINNMVSKGKMVPNSYTARAMNQYYKPIFAERRSFIDEVNKISSGGKIVYPDISTSRAGTPDEKLMCNKFESIRKKGVEDLLAKGYSGPSETQAVADKFKIVDAITYKGTTNDAFLGPRNANTLIHSHPFHRGPISDNDWKTARNLLKFDRFYLYVDSPNITGGGWAQYNNTFNKKIMTRLIF